MIDYIINRTMYMMNVYLIIFISVSMIVLGPLLVFVAGQIFNPSVLH